MDTEKKVRVRMAPSPTGLLHVGTVRTALFNWLFARHHGGTFILRVEDTDKERSKLEYEISLKEGLEWLGIDWDEGPVYKYLEGGEWQIDSMGACGPYRQSEREEIYKTYIDRLLKEGHAYQCYCTKEELEAQREESEARGVPYRYPGTCRNISQPPANRAPQVIRLRLPEGTISFNDLIRGKVSFESEELDDFAIARSSGDPLHNLAVTVDDHLMEITHVIRGDDLISNTPRQIAIYNALGLTPPEFAHLPMILDSEKKKLSKRTGKTNFKDYAKEGYLKEAMMNFLALLGWHVSGDKEEFTREELISAFDLGRVQKSGAVFDVRKLQWLNKAYMLKLTENEICDLAKKFYEETGEASVVSDPRFKPAILKSRSRASTFSEFPALTSVYFSLPEYDPLTLCFKNSAPDDAEKMLLLARERLEPIGEDSWTESALRAVLMPLADAEGRGRVLWPLRVALSGKEVSPDPFDLLSVMGKPESLKRIDKALATFK